MPLSLPPRCPVCAAGAHADGGQGGPARASLLLAEDDAAVRSLLARVLRSRGYHVSEADDGLAALAMAGAAPFDLIVTDVQMPGLNGPAFVERLRAGGHAPPVIYITGYAEALITAGEHDTVLRKPFSPQGLVDAVEQALGRR